MPKGIPKNGINKGRFKKGMTSWNKGSTGGKLTEKHKGKIRKSMKGGNSTSFKKGHKQSEENVGKLRKKMKGNKYRVGLKPANAFKKGHLKPKNANSFDKGKGNPNWKNGITSENERIRKSIEYRLWREAVFARDNFICQKYGTKGGKLVAHHLDNFAQFPKLRFAIDNGITLSERAHEEFHKKYSWKNNTKEQLEEFLELI